MNPFPSNDENKTPNGQPSTTPARSARVVVAGPGLSEIHFPPQRSVATVQLFAGAGFMRVSLEVSDLLTLKPKPPKRGAIDHFSDASRRRMMDYLAKVDYSKIPFWLDLTYPDIFPEDNERWKRDLEIFFKRLVRRWPEASGFWKLEFKPRLSGVNRGKLAPHYHLLVFHVPWSFPFQPERAKNYRLVLTTGHDLETGDERAECFTQVLADGIHVTSKWGLQDDFRQWAARNWYDVVSSQDERHFKAGTSATHLKSRQGSFRYASKRYVAKKEEVMLLNLKPGRFWGVFNRKYLPLGQRQCYRPTEKQAVQLRRFIRRYRRANTPPKKRRWLRKGSASNAAKGFSAKLYCKADFWIERLPRLLGPLPEPHEVKPVNGFQRELF